MTITLAAVYAPIGFQGGLTGSLFREFAFTLAGAVLISGIVALTLSPMMSSKLLKPNHDGWLPRQIDRAFDFVRRSYSRALGATLRNRPAVYVVWIGLALLVVPMYVMSPQELAPNEDQGVVFGALDVPPNATLEQMTPYSEQMNRLFMTTPEFDHTSRSPTPPGASPGCWSSPGRSGSGTSSDPGRISPKLATITGVRAPAFLPSALPSAGRSRSSSSSRRRRATTS